MSRWILSVVILLLLSLNMALAEQLATKMKGQVVVSSPAGLRVYVTEHDGSILDMTAVTDAGVYKLDLTVMDTASQAEVNKLFVEVREKSEIIKKIPVADYLNIFGDTVLLKPIILN